MAARVGPVQIAVAIVTLLVGCTDSPAPAPVTTGDAGRPVNVYPDAAPLGPTTPTPNPTNPTPNPTPNPNPTPAPNPNPTPAPAGDACAACEQTSCTSQLSACNASPECAALKTCEDACTDDTTCEACETMHASGVDLAYAYWDCLDTSCATQCDGGDDDAE